MDVCVAIAGFLENADYYYGYGTFGK